ncbi:MAG: dihydroneopterin aldolase [Thermomicrobiales bacterium]|nr:dihydroneopterin aldolase [Thermomicrobiales bacterium]
MDDRTSSDEILLEGMRFYGYHGVHPEERKLGQRFVVDAALAVDLRVAGQRDELAQTVSYSEAFAAIRQVVEGEPRQLIEAVAEDVAAALLALDARITRVRVRVAKPEAPVKAALLAAVAVSITRQRRCEETGE